MSIGLYRKQYTALAEIADSFSITYTTPTGSFNEKFCSLCATMVTGLGGTFVGSTGTFQERKANYLKQLAVTLGMVPTLRQSLNMQMLQSARYLFDNYGDGETPTQGASFEWRVYQYLSHALSVPISDLIQYINQTPSTDGEWPDSSGNDNVMLSTNSNCLTFNGADQYITTDLQSPGKLNVEAGTGFSTTTDSSCVLMGTGGITSSNIGFAIAIISGKIVLRQSQAVAGTYAVNISTTSTYNDGETHSAHFTFDRDTRAVVLYVDDEEITTTSLSDLGEESYGWCFGADNAGASLPFEGTLYSSYVNDRALFPMTAGDGEDAYNVYANTGTEIEAIVMFGQSNMVGSTVGDPSDEYVSNQDDWIYTYDSQSVDGVGESLGLKSGDWGPEIIVGKEVTDSYGSTKRVLIKFAKDGMTLDKFDDGGYYHDEFIECINNSIDNLKARGYAPTVTNVMVMQGETDALTETLADAWKDTLYSIRTALIEKTPVSEDTNWIFGRINVPLRTYRTTIRTAQEELGDELGSWIDTDSFSLKDDSIHYDNDGCESLGNAFADNVSEYTASGSVSTYQPNGAIEIGVGSTTVMWAGSQSAEHYDLLNGCSKVLVFDGATGYVALPTLTQSDTGAFEIEIIGRTLDLTQTSTWIYSCDGATDLYIRQDATSLIFRHAGIGTGSTTATLFSDLAYHDIVCGWDGAEVYITQDGEDVSRVTATGTLGADAFTNPRIARNYGTNSNFWQGEVASVCICADETITYNASNAYDTTLPATSDTSNDATLVSDVGLFKYYPALSDGSDDVMGLGITNPAGNWHNGSETEVIQDAANPDIAELLTRTIFSDDGSTLTDRAMDELWDYVNGYQNVFYLRTTVDGTRQVVGPSVYAYDKQFTPTEWLRLQYVLADDEGTTLVPATVTAGTGIGPDLAWADNGDGEILLVTET